MDPDSLSYTADMHINYDRIKVGALVYSSYENRKNRVWIQDQVNILKIVISTWTFGFFWPVPPPPSLKTRGKKKRLMCVCVCEGESERARYLFRRVIFEYTTGAHSHG